MADRVLIEGGCVVAIDDSASDVAPGNVLGEGVRNPAEDPELATLEGGAL